MKSIVLVTLHILFVQVLYSQNTCESNNLSSQAEILYRQKRELPKAVDLYKAAFKLNLTDDSKVLDALNAATILKDTSSVIDFLRSCVSIGLSPTSMKILWPQIGSGLEYANFISAIDTIAVINKYVSNLDSNMIKQLTTLAENDQKYRGEENYPWRLQRSLDSLNWLELKDIVQRKGRLPYYKEIGLDGQENLEILFYHMDKNVIEWFLPHIVQCVNEDNSNLGHVVLYQLDRIGMSDGLVYTINSNLKIDVLCKRMQMKNGYYCQSFGEWFDEKSPIDNKVYETPIDPNVSINEVNKIRSLFCLDSLEAKRLRKPWVNVVSIREFESLINE